MEDGVAAAVVELSRGCVKVKFVMGMEEGTHSQPWTGPVYWALVRVRRVVRKSVIFMVGMC
jgi:hypothetical protein